MKKRLLTITVITVFIIAKLNAQVSIFSEDFETASEPENIANPYLGWQNGQFATTTNNNYFWVFNNTRCNVINGTYSMAVSKNNPATSGTLPQYKINKTASTFVYNTTAIDATNYTNLTLDFNWICEGEADFDYGTVLYSLDALSWATLPGTYQGQSTVQNVTNLDLSVLDGQIFYLGFGWDNDRSIGTFPGFIVDDIDVKGTPLTPCSAPTNQPTVLNLTPTSNSILGTFTAATPVPDNYLVLISTSAVAPTPVNGTAYTIGNIIGTGTVVDVDANTIFTATGLIPNTTYYIYIYAFNSLCSGGPIYNATTPLSGSATTINSSYCIPITSNNINTKFINDVEFIGNLVNDVNLGNGTSTTSSGYSDYTGRTNTVQAQGQGVNIYVGSSTGRGLLKAWVDWNKDDDFTDPGEEVYNTGGVVTTTTTFGFVIDPNQTIGDYRIRIRFYNAEGYYDGRRDTCDGYYENFSDGANHFDSCTNFTSYVSNVNFGCGNRNVTWLEYGEAEDYLFTVVESCAAQITSISEANACGPGSADLQVTGNAFATGFNWYANETGGTPIATSATFSPVISATTTYWVTATGGVCESLKRVPVTATLNPITELTITPEIPIICGNNDVIQISASGSTELAYLINEDFEAGGTGVFSVVNVYSNGSTQDGLSEWQNRTSTFVPNQYVWYPAISSGFGTNHFVMATSDINPSGIIWTSLESPLLDSSTFTDLTLSFDMYFSKYSAASTPDDIYIFVSTDGGANFNTIQNISTDIGIGTNFQNLSFDLSAYINEPNLIITIDYVADWMDGVALDNVKLFGSRPLSPSFTWTGTVDAYLDAATTIPYTSGTPASSVYIKPTLAQLALGDFSFTANGTLSNGCTISKDFTIKNDSKIWNGSVSTDWNTAANWTPSGAPSSSQCIYIPNTSRNPVLTGATNGEGLRLTVANGGLLTQQTNSNLTITEAINVNAGGTYNVEDSASLIQVDNTTNTVNGTFTMKRSTNIRSQDYVYWSSPVTSFMVESISPNTPTNLIYKWNPSFNRGASPPPNSVPNDYGRWEGASGTMAIGEGYIVRGSTTGFNPVTASNFTATFSGIPNNGDITNVPISRGTFDGLPYNGPGSTNVTADDDNWNMLGNPYPSAISAIKFTNDNTNIDGTIYLWTHATQLANNPLNDPFYADYVYNYSDDYMSYNNTGSINPGDPGDLFIGAGQGFFVFMLDDPVNVNLNTNSNVFFDNSMRDASYTNNVFYRSESPSPTNNIIERHRIWLDLVSSNNIATTILVGYVDGATNDDDRLYDGYSFSSEFQTRFYSLTQNKEMSIQGRALPFDISDTVPLGIVLTQQDSYTIAINTIDGLFLNEEQDIFLEDTYTNTIHNLKLSPYSFTSESGTFNDRFILRYTTSTLNIKDVDALNGIKVFEENEKLIVKSVFGNIQSIEVYDILGRNLFINKTVSSNRFTINSLNPKDTVLFLKIKLMGGTQKIAKINF